MAMGSGILYCCRLSYKPVPGVLGVEGGRLWEEKMEEGEERKRSKKEKREIRKGCGCRRERRKGHPCKKEGKEEQKGGMGIKKRKGRK